MADKEPFGISEQLDCSDCVNHGGDWDCDHVHCRKGTDTISRQAAIDALNLADDRGEIRSVMDAVVALKALPPVFSNLDEIQMEIYVSGYEKGVEESFTEVLNAFKKVRDELPEDKREEYTDDFCKIMGRMLDELEKKE